MTKTVKVATTSGSREIPAVWVGTHLAVHRPVLADGAAAAAKRWAVTHTATGLSMGGTLTTTKPEALALAKLWDGAAAEIDPANPRGWRFLKTWQLDVAVVENRRIAELVGPVLPDCPTAGDVAAAMSAAIGGSFQPAAEDEGGEPFPAHETMPGDRIRPGEDAWPDVFWRGKWWPVPTLAEVEAWAFDSVAETPDGRTVEPDHPEAWPRILGVI